MVHIVVRRGKGGERKLLRVYDIRKRARNASILASPAGKLMIELGFFGLLCGICYWLMRDKRSADKESVPARLSPP